MFLAFLTQIFFIRLSLWHRFCCFFGPSSQLKGIRLWCCSRFNMTKQLNVSDIINMLKSYWNTTSVTVCTAVWTAARKLSEVEYSLCRRLAKLEREKIWEADLSQSQSVVSHLFLRNWYWWECVKACERWCKLNKIYLFYKITVYYSIKCNHLS